MKSDNTFLETILAAKKKVVAAKKLAEPRARLERELGSMKPFSGLGFFDALKSAEPVPKIIAEVKKASPSKGVIRDDFSLREINDAYQTAPNVAAISVLTEKDYFQGGDDVLAFFAANNTHDKPLLRKDFIFDAYQVLESKLLGAHAYLLIVALLGTDTLNELVDLGLKIGIEPVVEAHDEEELVTAKSTNARVIGVNCRDLKTFTIDRDRHNLLRQLDASYARIAESDIDSPEYLEELSGFSDAALIGTEFMKSKNIPAAINALLPGKARP
jgi:indole-3-glycerol phosphate synthase